MSLVTSQEQEILGFFLLNLCMCSVSLLQEFGRKERKKLPVCGKDKLASLWAFRWAAALP